MYNQCRTPFFNISLLNWSKYFLTAFDFILAIANVFGFSPAVTSWYTSSRVESFCCSSAICFGVTCSKVETTFKLLTILFSFMSSSSMMAQLIFSTSCLRSSGIFVLLRHRSTASQTNEYEMTSHSSLSASLSVKLSSQVGLNGWQLSASVALLDWPVWYLMTKSKNASSLSHQICDAPNLLSMI